MNYAKILTADIASGPGFRVSMWVTGCEHKCPGCFNQELWATSTGHKFGVEAKAKILKEMEKSWIHGFTFLGGEPLSTLSDNRKETIAFCKELKEKFPNKDIVLFTGYTYEELKKDDTANELFDYVDILIDGRFELDKKDTTLAWRGSSNQRVIDVKKSKSKVVEFTR